MKTRLYFLDNLRTFMIFLVVVLHAGNVYQPTLDKVWLVSDPQKSETIGFIHLFLDIFVMYIIFFVSGYFAPRSLKGRNNWNFLLSKFKRIMLPWLIAVLTLIPLYKIIFLYSRDLPQEEWYSYFHIYQRTGTDLIFFANNPAQNWLWFLPVLFMFQFLYYLLAKSKILSFTLSFRSAIVLTFFTSVLYCLAITALHQRGWYHSTFLHFKKERLLVYFLGFLLGSQFYSQGVFQNKTNKRSIISTGLLLLGSLVVYTMISLNFMHTLLHPGNLHYLFGKKADTVLLYCSMIISMIGITTFFFLLFKKWFNIRNRILDELNRNSYPLYIIHVIILGIIALFFLEIKTNVIGKYIMLIILTFITSNLIISGFRQLTEKSFHQGKQSKGS